MPNIVLISDDILFRDMLEIEIVDHLQKKCASFSSSDRAMIDLLYQAKLTVLDLSLPREQLENIIEIASDSGTKILAFSNLDRGNVPEQERYLYDSNAITEVLIRPFPVQYFLYRVTSLCAVASEDALTIRTESTMEMPKPQIKLNQQLHHIYYGNQTIALTNREYSLMSCLYLNRGKTVTREMLFRATWGNEKMKNNIVDVYVRYLRKKLDEVLKTKIIYSVRGIGYRIPAENEEETSC